MSVTSADYPIGIIEGFYGKTWSHADRLDYADFLSTEGFSHYIYAPKADAFLRKEWRKPLPAENIDALTELSGVYREKGLAFGVGLSPYEIYLDWGTDERSNLKRSISSLNEANLDVLAILYDDMRGDVPGLAQLQSDIVSFAAELSTAKRVLMCPTYYSYDPVLERVFGKMPENYLSDLGRLMDPRVEIYWTGRKVVSGDYGVEHLEEVAALLRRKPHIWDNYPVNDSEKMSPFLHLRPVANRGAHLKKVTSGWTANPMNQPHLSKIPLRSLSTSLSGSAEADDSLEFARHAAAVCSDDIARSLKEDLVYFQDVGLKELSDQDRQMLTARYANWKGQPIADEVLAWLNGQYEFDPACLTD